MTTRDSGAAVRGGLALALTQILSRVLAVVFVLAATHRLGAETFGRYSIVSAVVVVAAMLADFGTSAVVTRELSRGAGGSRNIVEVVLPLSAILGLLAYAGCVVFAMAAGYPHSTMIDIALGAVAVPLGSVATSLLAALDGTGAIWRRAVIGLVQSVVTMGCGLLAVTIGHSVRLAVIALALGPLVALTLASLMTRRLGAWTGALRFHRLELQRLLHLAAPFAALSFIGAISLRFDVIFLSIVATRSETAAYDVALRGVEAILTMSTVLTGPLLFLLSSRIGRGDVPGAQRAFDEAVRLATVVALPVAAVAIALHDELTRVAFGPSFQQASVPLALLGAQVAPAAIGYLQGSLLMASDHARRGARVAGEITAVIVVLDVALIPKYGAVGAAVASLVTSIVTVVMFARFHRTTSGIITRWPPLRAIGAALACGVAAWGLRELPLVVPIAVGGTLYVVIVIATRLFGLADVRRIVKVART